MDDLVAALARKDGGALLTCARLRLAGVLRSVTGRLYSASEAEKWQAVWGIGVLVGDRQLVGEERVVDLLRRFFWALNDESGAVPYGVPEAVGEILAARPELQPVFLSILCAHLTEEDMAQTGPIERGLLWALGRVGPPVGQTSPEAVEALRRLAGSHPDPETRATSAWALARIHQAADTEPVQSWRATDQGPMDAGGPG
jgi:hypothetical protein